VSGTVLALAPSLPARQAPPGDELSDRLATLKRQADDVTLPIGQRETAVLEMAGALDRAAQRETTVDQREARWGQAVGLLDAFNSESPGHPRAYEFRLQAAVYRWAVGQSLRDLLELNPDEDQWRPRATAALDDAITRLRALPEDALENVLADNIRFRLARALADRADLEPADSRIRRSMEADALALLKHPATEPGLQGFAGLLRADLLRRSGRLDEAAVELEAAARTKPSPPEAEVLAVRMDILSGQKKYNEAAAAVKGTSLPEPAKELALFRLRLAECAGLAPGPDRFPVEQDVFRLAAGLRQRNSGEARLAMAALAGSDLEPDARHDPQVWDIIAQASAVRGDADKAAKLEEHAARRAQELGQAEATAGFRLRGGGFLFQAGKFAAADALLSRVADDPKAGALRAKAGMLRSLARGQALAAGAPGVTATGYAAALQQQIREFPKDPSTDEARWLLGSLVRDAGEPARASTLWMEIPPGASRWLDARLAVAEMNLTALEKGLVIGDRQALMDRYRRAQAHLVQSLKQAKSDAEQAALSLAQARLNLVPTVGRPQLAMALLERTGRMPLSTLDRYRARLLRMIGLVLVGPPYVEAEREAQSHASWAEPSARSSFFDAIRLLDLCASHSEYDLNQRRLGMVLRLLVQAPAADADDEKWTPLERAELKIRFARAFLFLGDDRSARVSLRGWPGPPSSTWDDLLRDLADTYNRLEAYELAVDVERLRSKHLAVGSPSWFEARYGLALAYFHLDRFDDATRLIDATAILHPDLGGGTLQKKFIRLRQRLGSRS
jgi:tetratricopeptide (TPR) repeat protein